MANNSAADKHLLSMVTHLPRDQAPRGISEPGTSSAGRNYPPVERFYNMKIDRHGTWYHEGRPIARIALVKLFASVLRKESDGTYWLVTPVERGPIDVEDVPFVIVELSVEGSGVEQRLSVRSNLDEWVTIGPNHPLLFRKPPYAPPAAASVPYIDVRNGLEGRMLRPVYYELADLCEPDQQEGVTRYGFWSCEQFFVLDDGL